jgi:transcription antitermination factor NusG
MCYIIRIESKKNKIMKEKNNITEAQLLLNQEVRVNRGQFTGQTGVVNSIMADGRSLDITLANGKVVFLDVTLVGEIRERTQYAKTEQSLGPVANSVVQDHI